MILGGCAGQKIGNYIVRYRLGEGGMGTVYLAEHSSIGKQVAIKLLHRALASQSAIVDRFFSEAKAVNAIKHENVVDVFDFGILPPPDPEQPPVVYLLMELLDGESLGALIEREAPLPPERAIRIAIQIADALGAAHRARIIHRDLKPDNVMLIQRGRQRDFVKVLDFGIAKQVDRAAEDPWTLSGVAIGTPQYMSPEQCRARKDIDSRSDIYAMGIVLYEMLTGVVPFDGAGLNDVLLQQTTTPPRPPTALNPLIPAPLERVVLKALEKDASDRYQSMHELIAALEGASSAVSAPRAGVMPVIAGPGGLVQASPRAEIDQQVAAPSPVGVATTLSGSIAQLGGTLAPWRRRGLAVTMGVVAGVGMGAGLLGLPGAEPPAVVAGRELPSDTTAAGDRGGGSGNGALPLSELVPAVEPVGAPAPPAAAEREPPASSVGPRRGRIAIRSTPPSATVWIDGVARGVTPYFGELEGGAAPVELLLSLDGYEPLVRRFVQRSDGAHTFVLQPQRQGKPLQRGTSDPAAERRDRLKNPFTGAQRLVRP